MVIYQENGLDRLVWHFGMTHHRVCEWHRYTIFLSVVRTVTVDPLPQLCRLELASCSKTRLGARIVPGTGTTGLPAGLRYLSIIGSQK